MVPEPRRFSTPRPSLVPMMSVMMYLYGDEEHEDTPPPSSQRFKSAKRSSGSVQATWNMCLISSARPMRAPLLADT
ncbi:hypothetical protein EYF80_033106 [Liparis tanakae]|uniref:Uncharacterized protein n=1 Tax=Liparis tanakae TaxID=230148 RepID=A0A4Z2GTF3_9TELE|nr:hypothetical protein EYF80_033106 [Liparis tanakae]